jgi:hypothetical protein
MGPGASSAGVREHGFAGNRCGSPFESGNGQPGARVAVGQAEIGVNDADQIELGDAAMKAKFKQYFMRILVSPIFFYA